LESEIILRDIKEDDLPITFKFENEPEGYRMAAFPPRNREAFMAHWEKVMKDPKNIVKTVLVDGEVAGGVFSWEQDGERLVGYWLGKEYWGRGIATRALSIFLDQVKIRPMYARVAEHNVASIRVLEKCGFKVIGHDKGFPFEGQEIEEVIMELGRIGGYVQ
jgi:RimJ/RimL family protein N-acetyltransferase